MPRDAITAWGREHVSGAVALDHVMLLGVQFMLGAVSHRLAGLVGLRVGVPATAVGDRDLGGMRLVSALPRRSDGITPLAESLSSSIASASVARREPQT